MRTRDRRSIRLVSLLSLALACTTEPAPASQTVTQPSSQPEPPQQEPKPLPEVTTANPPLDPPPPEPKLPPVEGFFMAEGAPQPRACTSAKDCLGDTIPDLDNPCCQNPYTLEPHAWAYRTWMTAWRQDHCASVTCPPPPPPAMPPECAFQVDCVQGRCVDACK
jgi:hypothetical protein